MKNFRRGVLISGAYGMHNAGDDAVLRAVVASLREFDAAVPIRVLARGGKKTAKAFGVEVIHPLNLFGLWAALGKTKLFISGGGSLLQDVTSQRSLWYYLGCMALAKKRGCAVQVYGCGMGPVTREKNRRRCARILNGCADVITLRDAESEKTLRAWGVERPVILAADPAFRMKLPAGEREKAVGFALRAWDGFWYRVPFMAAAARYAFERYGLTPVFFCFAPEDVRAAKSVMAALGDIPCRLVSDPKAAGRMTVTVSMRLHGLIFALAGGASPVGLSYDPKVAAFCEENGLPWQGISDVTEQSLCALMDRAMEADAESLSVTAEKLRRRERANAAAAWELLGRGDDG